MTFKEWLKKEYGEISETPLGQLHLTWMEKAWNAGREDLIGKNPFDTHLDTASKIFNVSKEEVTDEQRKLAKRTNFESLYNKGK